MKPSYIRFQEGDFELSAKTGFLIYVFYQFYRFLFNQLDLYFSCKQIVLRGQFWPSFILNQAGVLELSVKNWFPGFRFLSVLPFSIQLIKLKMIPSRDITMISKPWKSHVDRRKTQLVIVLTDITKGFPFSICFTIFYSTDRAQNDTIPRYHYD